MGIFDDDKPKGVITSHKKSGAAEEFQKDTTRPSPHQQAQIHAASHQAIINGAFDRSRRSVREALNKLRQLEMCSAGTIMSVNHQGAAAPAGIGVKISPSVTRSRFRSDIIIRSCPLNKRRHFHESTNRQLGWRGRRSTGPAAQSRHLHDQNRSFLRVARDTPGVRFWAPIGRYRRFASTETEKGDFVYSPSGFRIAKYCRVSGRKRTQAIPTKIVK